MPAVKRHSLQAFGARRRSVKPRGSSGGRVRCANPNETTSDASAASLPSASPSPGSSLQDLTSEQPADVSSSLPEDYEVVEELTAIERKISLLQESDPAADPTDAPAAPDGAPTEGYRLVALSAIETLVSALLCPVCRGSDLQLSESGKGVQAQFVVACPDCGDVARTPHSSTIGHSRQNELAARISLASRECGIGYTKLTNFFAGINAPSPMHLRSYQDLGEKVHDASVRAASNVMSKAAEAVRETRESDSGDLMDVCVTYDGTWHKRGHTSHFGVGVAIELETGLVLDYSVQSNYCHGCSLGPAQGSDSHEDWAKNHRAVCQKNFAGSANAMELQAAGEIFRRSVQLHNLQYVTVLCDGDSKAFNHVAGLDLYDKGMRKEDCVNHVAKRMYAGMEALKKTKKGLGGRGKLTNLVMKKLTSYYASALKTSAPDVPAMQKAVFASLLHSYSTDEEPRHQACPHGEHSWSHFNRQKALEAAGEPTKPQPHRPAFSRDIAKELVPLYNRLSRRDLLERCARMGTQNNKESLNTLVWRRCPKTDFASRRTVETAVALAVLEFNLGPKGFERALHEMGIEPRSHQVQHADKALQAKVSKAKQKALNSSKVAHKQRKLAAIAKAQRDQAAEGETYSAGAF
ncbi:hypothetical protein ISCGN_001900 [Ixodes scapularis]